MPKRILLDEFHSSVLIPSSLSDRQTRAIRRHLRDKQFLSDLRAAVRSVFRRKPSLRPVHLCLSS